VVAPYPKCVSASSPVILERTPEPACAQASRAIAIVRSDAPLPNSAFQTLAARLAAPVGRTSRTAAPSADWPMHKFPGQPLEVESRNLNRPECQFAARPHGSQVLAAIGAARQNKIAGTSEQAYQARPMALLRRNPICQPAVAEYLQPMLAHLARTAGLQQLVTAVDASDAHQLSVAMRRATPAKRISTFEALPESAPDISKCIDDRYPRFVAHASIPRHVSAGVNSQISLRVPEFLVAASKRKNVCPSRPRLFWDPGWLGPDQFVEWSPWIGAFVGPANGASFPNHPAARSLALAAANSSAGLIRIASWTEASETLNQSALVLQLPRREGDAALVQIRPAPAAPAAAERPPREATQTFAAKPAPGGTKSAMRWVSYTVPFRPIP